MSKYKPLMQELERLGKSEATFRFTELEGLVGPLPASAYRLRQWWGNDNCTKHVHHHSQAHAWRDAGFEVKEVQLGHSVTFRRLRPARREH